LSRSESGRFGALNSHSAHHFFRNACTKSGSTRFSVFRLLTDFVCLLLMNCVIYIILYPQEITYYQFINIVYIKGIQDVRIHFFVYSLVKIQWRMLILQCSQGCYKVQIRPCDFDLWPWKSIGIQILLRTKSKSIEGCWFSCVCLCIVVSNTCCVVFFFLLCTLCCQFLWNVNFWLHLRHSLRDSNRTKSRSIEGCWF
jgi:hypothetical protein